MRKIEVVGVVTFVATDVVAQEVVIISPMLMTISTP